MKCFAQANNILCSCSNYNLLWHTFNGKNMKIKRSRASQQPFGGEKKKKKLKSTMYMFGNEKDDFMNNSF